MNKVLNAWITQLCGVMKGVIENIDGGVFPGFSHVENDRIAKRVYVGECTGSHLVGRLQKRWIDTVKECLRRGLDVRQAGRMVHDRSVWQKLMRGNAWAIAWVMNP